MTIDPAKPSAGELRAMLRRAQGEACDSLRRRPDWSPARDIDVCVCGASLLQHAARFMADRLEQTCAPRSPDGTE